MRSACVGLVLHLCSKSIDQVLVTEREHEEGIHISLLLEIKQKTHITNPVG